MLNLFAQSYNKIVYPYYPSLAVQVINSTHVDAYTLYCSAFDSVLVVACFNHYPDDIPQAIGHGLTPSAKRFALR